MSSQNSAITGPQDSRNLLILLFAGFVLSGIATVIISPLLPVFIGRWSLNDSQAGLFSMVQFTAAWAGTLASSAIASWRGYRPALVLGYALMGGGLAFLNGDTHVLALAATATFGFGYGLLTAGTNLLVAELGGVRSASLVSLLNFMWGVGAMTCPLLIAFALKHNRISIMLISFAVFGIVMVIGLLFSSFGPDERPHESKVAETTSSGPAFHVTLALASLFFVYVAMENAIGFWSAEFSRRLANGITGVTTLAPTFFYGGLTLGRASAALALHRLKEKTVVLGALALAAAGNVLLIASPSLYVAIVAVFVAGLGCASIYPIYIAWLSRWYGARAKKIGGVLFALASLGGSAGPWLVGAVSQFSASLRIGLGVPLLCALVMIALVLLLRRQTAA